MAWEKRRKVEWPEMSRTRKKRTMPVDGVDEDKGK